MSPPFQETVCLCFQLHDLRLAGIVAVAVAVAVLLFILWISGLLVCHHRSRTNNAKT